MLTAPTFKNFAALVLGWVVCLGRRTFTRVVRAAAPWTDGKDDSVFPRLLSRAVWAVEKLTPVLGSLVQPWLPEVPPILVDDTLCRKTGPHLWGAGMHHDPLRSTHGGSRSVSSAYGHNWVVLSMWVPLPGNPVRGVAIPVAFRLYRQKRRCPPGEYRKRTDLAREALDAVLACLPGRRVCLVGDREYACLPRPVQQAPGQGRLCRADTDECCAVRRTGGSPRPRAAKAQIVDPTQPGTSEWTSGLAEVAVTGGDAREHRAIAALS